MKILKTLFISGFNMKVNDGSPFWDVADRILSLTGEGTVFRQTWDSLHPDDLEGMDIIIPYSYGCSALWHAMMCRVWRTDQVKKLFILAGVPRWLWGYTQGGGFWNIPSCFASATAFNVTPIGFDPFEPISCPITNSIENKFENIDLNSYCSGMRHISIQAVSLWSDIIYSFIQNEMKE